MTTALNLQLIQAIFNSSNNLMVIGIWFAR